MNTKRLLSACNDLVLNNPRTLAQIETLYDKVSEQLESFSKFDDPENTYILEAEFETQRDIQDQLISLARGLPINQLTDIRNLVNFWHKVTISERTDTDILETDCLIIAIYDYFKNAPTLAN